ncbi:MAG: PDR/VanB family oxidoreductase [Sphingomonas sp.]
MRLSAIRYGSETTNFYEFRPVDGGVVRAFTSGAHVDLHLPGGLVRQYSIVSSQRTRDHYLLGIKREDTGRGGSRAVHEALKVGAILKVGGPRNHFPLVEDGSPVIFIAGGIGVTPLYSMLDRAREIGLDWTFHYAMRARADAVLVADLESRGDRVRIHADDEFEGRPIALAEIIAAAPRNAHLYCCGPAPMLDAFETLAAAAGFPPEQIHVERFSADPAPATTTGFIVELARSGIEVAVGPGQTILECARAVGVPVEASCEQGVCGSCETRVLGGVPDHRDMILTEAERRSNKTMMICCSGSLTERLKLEL